MDVKRRRINSLSKDVPRKPLEEESTQKGHLVEGEDGSHVQLSYDRVFHPKAWGENNPQDPLAGVRFLSKHFPLGPYTAFLRNHAIAHEIFTHAVANGEVDITSRLNSNRTMRERLKKVVQEHLGEFHKLKFPSMKPLQWRFKDIYDHIVEFRKRQVKSKGIRDADILESARAGHLIFNLFALEQYVSLEEYVETGGDDYCRVLFGEGIPFRYFADFD